jgi:hypothetical protein
MNCRLPAGSVDPPREVSLSESLSQQPANMPQGSPPDPSPKAAEGRPRRPAGPAVKL